MSKLNVLVELYNGVVEDVLVFKSEEKAFDHYVNFYKDEGFNFETEPTFENRHELFEEINDTLNIGNFSRELTWMQTPIEDAE